MTLVMTPNIIEPPAPTRLRRRVLISAYACSPVRGSEPSAGWNIPLRLAAYHDVTVLCTPHVRGEPQRDEIETYLRDHGPVPGLSFHYVEPPRLSRMLQRDNDASLLRHLYYTGYAAWQRAALRDARRLHRERPFDLVHHLNITGYREPGYLWRMNVPFVWGPVGGASNMPWGYFSQLGWRDRAFYALRNVANSIQKRVNLRCRMAAARASHIWVVGDDNEHLVRALWGRPCEQMTDSAATARPGARVRDGTRPLRLAWSGLHIGRKALPILLHAMAKLPDVPIQLTVLGDGPLMQPWKALASQLGQGRRIRWTGKLAHAAAVEEVERGDVFVFTSVQEGTPYVVTEALSLGLPVVCHDACGMRLAVTNDCGVKIPLRTARGSVDGFAAALKRLATDPAEVQRLSRGALRRAEELSWDNKAAAIAASYDRVLAARSAS